MARVVDLVSQEMCLPYYRGQSRGLILPECLQEFKRQATALQLTLVSMASSSALIA